jgi:hypothetical protein
MKIIKEFYPEERKSTHGIYQLSSLEYVVETKFYKKDGFSLSVWVRMAMEKEALFWLINEKGLCPYEMKFDDHGEGPDTGTFRSLFTFSPKYNYDQNLH